MASERAATFIEKATAVALKDKLTEMGLDSMGSKAILKLRLQEAVKRISEVELTLYFPENLLETSSYQPPVENIACELPPIGNDNTDAELSTLREIFAKKQEIADLKRKISELSAKETINPSRHQFNLREVEESFTSFSGDTSYPIQKWISHFEESADLLEWDTKTRFIYAKRLMSGTAQLYLRTINVKSWLELKMALTSEFGQKSSKSEIHDELRKRQKKREETWQQYVFSMVEIASLADLEELDIVQYIIKGIPDSSANKMLLYAANNIAELKDGLRKYYLMKSHTQSQRSTELNLNNHGATVQQQRDRRIKCFNCNGVGHTATNCPKPKRSKGSCFGCGRLGHRIQECQQSKQQVMTLQHTKNGLQNNTNKYNSNPFNDFEFNLRYDFDNINEGKMVFSATLCSLIDSGSSISFIQQRYLPAELVFPVDSDMHSFSGINDSPLLILGTTKTKVSFKDSEVVLDMFIVKDNSMRFPVVLGRDFMKKCNLELFVKDDLNIENTTTVRISEETDFSYQILNIDAIEPNNLPPLEINENVSHVIRNRLVDIVSGACSSDKPTTSLSDSKVELNIRLSKDEPFHCTPRRIPFAHKEKLKIIIDDLLKQGIIRESDSPYASPIVLVPKKNNELRLCIDYRILNKYTVRDNYPLPLIEDLLDGLRDKKYFSSLDLKNGFHHVKVAPDSIKFTSFVTPIGQFEYLRMPFGLKNAPSIFQRYIHSVFKELIAKEKLFIYMDDILIATGSIEEHLLILEEVVSLICRHSLQLRFDKCKFLQEEIIFLGYKVNSAGIRPNDDNLRAISNFSIPKCIKGVHSFLGLASYFRKFIKNFAIMARPLYDLLRKDATFKFGPKEHQTFIALKDMLSNAPVLALFSPKNETELHCDASGAGFGAILLQRQTDGKLHPIFYFSKRTTEVESRYHSYELETLAIIYALRRFRTYLLGTPFKIVTDCQSLALTLNRQTLNPRISRWALELQEYEYKIEHRAGNRMGHVDALSRCSEILIVEEGSFDYALAVAQSRDSSIKDIASVLEREESNKYALINGLIYRKYNKDVMFFVPSSMEERIIQVHHESLCHLGADKLYDYLRKIYWFPRMKDKIKKYMEGCLKCAYFSQNSGKVEGILYNIPKGKIPFEVLHIDHYGPLPGLKNRHVFVVVDGFSKFIKLYAVKSTSTKEVIDCLEMYFNSYSRPSKIISDRGSCFTSKDFSDFCSNYNIVHVKIATHSPQANGQVERVNRLLTPMLSKVVEETSTKSWPSKLVKIEFAVNNTKNRSTGFSPSQLLFGVNQKGEFCDGLMEYLDDRNQEKQRNLDEIRSKAAEAMCKSQQYNKEYYDKKHKTPRKYNRGDLVMIKNEVTNPGVNKKLLPKFRGPYEVTYVLKNDRYVIKDVNGLQLTRLPYKGVSCAANMKPYVM